MIIFYIFAIGVMICLALVGYSIYIAKEVTRFTVVLTGNPKSDVKKDIRYIFTDRKFDIPTRIMSENKEKSIWDLNKGIVEGNDLKKFGLTENSLVVWNNKQNIDPSIIGKYIIISGNDNTRSALDPMATVNTMFNGVLVRKCIGIVRDNSPKCADDINGIKQRLSDTLTEMKVDREYITGMTADIATEIKKIHKLLNETAYVVTIRTDDKSFICEIYPKSSFIGEVVYSLKDFYNSEF